MAEFGSTKTQNRRALVIIALVAATLTSLDLLGNLPEATTPLERLELVAQDSTLRLRGRRQPAEEIVIVAIDDDSLSWVDERWPWPRSRIAEIVDWLNAAGARLIALDLFLFDKSTNAAEDETLAGSLSAANLAVSVSQIHETEITSTEGFTISRSTTLQLPEPVFRDALDGIGITEVERDDDAVVRSIKAFKFFNQEPYLHWAFEVYRLYTGQPDSALSTTTLQFSGARIPLMPLFEDNTFQGSRMLVNYAGPPRTYPTYSAAFVPLGDYPAEIFRDKIVLIGATSETLQDIYPTPFSSTNLMPGVEVVANAIATVLSGEYLRIAPVWVNVLLILATAFASVFTNRIPRPTAAVLLALGGMLAYYVIYYSIFMRSGWILPLVSPLAMLFLGIVLPTTDQAVTQEIEKRRVSDLFGRFVSPEMVTQLIGSRDLDSLNKRAELTILFSDIRDFTQISEQLPPDEVVSLLNPYLDRMTSIVHRHGGTVDKYEGDALIAFFGEPINHPDHAARAVKAAIEMQQALEELGNQWRGSGSYEGKFEMGVGINTGEVFVGLLGSEQRVNYTVIGDNVNLAARLQDQTKELNWPILISASTYAQVQDEFEARFAGARLMKGKSEAVGIYKLIGPKGSAVSSERLIRAEA